METPLRNCLWNCVSGTIFSQVHMDIVDDYQNPYNSVLVNYIYSLWSTHFKETTDSIPRHWVHAYDSIKTKFFRYPWNEVYDFLEFTATNYQKGTNNQAAKDRVASFIHECNKVFEREGSAYRFVDRIIVEITNDSEIKEIELAANSPLKGISTHTRQALSLLSDKKNPDFRNSIKESISAVEAACNHLLKDESKTLGKALNALESSGMIKFHSAQKEAFRNLYGYTSDAEGIRHALLDDPSLDYDDAKFMLVACSAFANYLISKTKQ